MYYHFLDSTWESKEIKSNTTITPVIGAAADFKYLIRIPKQKSDEHKNSDSSLVRDASTNKPWKEKYSQNFNNESDEDSEYESDNEEEVVILRCQTSVCEDDKCIPFEFDFVVHVRFGNEENTPQAADTTFSYTIPYKYRSN